VELASLALRPTLRTWLGSDKALARFAEQQQREQVGAEAAARIDDARLLEADAPEQPARLRVDRIEDGVAGENEFVAGLVCAPRDRGVVAAVRERHRGRRAAAFEVRRDFGARAAEF